MKKPLSENLMKELFALDNALLFVSVDMRREGLSNTALYDAVDEAVRKLANFACSNNVEIYAKDYGDRPKHLSQIYEIEVDEA